MPTNGVLRWFHLLYIRRLMPVIGWCLSGHWSAYRYLNESAETFPSGPRFERELILAGFAPNIPGFLGFGAAALYVGDLA